VGDVRIGAGRFRNALLPQAGPDVRPVGGRLRQSLFTALLPVLSEARVLDLCAGVGGLGLEALSRGAVSVVLVESDRRTADALRRWIADRGLGVEASVIVGDARQAPVPAGPYDVVFLDPPFRVWDDPEAARPFVAAAVAAAGAAGLVAVKLPARAAVPADPRWRVVEHRPQGDVAWARVVAAAPAPTGPSGRPEDRPPPPTP
jgi:16S rRNA (guanine966-N2)-methyltransferase